MKTFAIVSLGCARNLVDSEVMAGSLRNAGFALVDIDKNPDICIVNTCSFVKDARDEAIDAILEALDLKKKGKVRHVIVTGCLPQLYKKSLFKELSDVDAVLGTSDINGIAGCVKKILSKGRDFEVSSNLTYLYDEKSPRSYLTPKHYAYIKISEGCDNRCSYCLIPNLRGSLRSRAIESIAKEVKVLSEEGLVKEVNLIGQDITVYGRDLHSELSLAKLLRKLTKSTAGIEWFRMLYTHPAHYTGELIDVISGEGRICKYLDIPIQHCNDRILKAMNRKVTRYEIVSLIDNIRKRVPGVVLRTSLIVGFPGETEKEFNELKDFVKDIRFEKCGVFTYSRESGTMAAKLKGQIPEREKQSRYDEIMKIQRGIARDINKAYLSKDLRVLIDEKSEGENGEYIGRTECDAPDIDGVVYVKGKDLKIGEFYSVKIIDTLEYDLVGKA